MKKNIRKLIVRSTSALLGTAMILSCFLQNVHAENGNIDPIIMVSLGDSYSSGEGIEPFYGQDKKISEKVKDKNWLAHRSKKSWTGLLEVPGLTGTMKDYNVDPTSIWKSEIFGRSLDVIVKEDISEYMRKEDAEKVEA